MSLRASRAKHFGSEEIDLEDVTFTESLIGCIPSELARRCRALPVSDRRRSLRVALADPSDIETIDLLHRTLQRDIEICVADERQLDDFIERLYKGDDDRRG
jgi:hypothetical protein